PGDQLRDDGRVEAEVNQVEVGPLGVERNSLCAQTAQHRIRELQRGRDGAEAERHAEHDRELDAQRPAFALAQGRYHPDTVTGACAAAQSWRARKPFTNGQPINIRMALPSPITSSTGVRNGSRMSRSPSALSTRRRIP